MSRATFARAEQKPRISRSSALDLGGSWLWDRRNALRPRRKFPPMSSNSWSEDRGWSNPRPERRLSWFRAAVDRCLWCAPRKRYGNREIEPRTLFGPWISAVSFGELHQFFTPFSHLCQSRAAQFPAGGSGDKVAWLCRRRSHGEENSRFKFYETFWFSPFFGFFLRPSFFN